MEERNKNLEKRNSKIRKILKWIGIFFIVFGVSIPVILISKGFTAVGYLLPALYGITLTFTPGFIAFGIILILTGKIISKKLTPKAKKIAILFIILFSPLAFQATLGNITSFIITKFYLINHNIVRVSEGYKIPKEQAVKVIQKAISLKEAKECKDLFPFPFNSFHPSQSFFYFFPFVGWIGDYRFLMEGHNTIDWFTQCVSAVAIEKEDIKISPLTEKFPHIK